VGSIAVAAVVLVLTAGTTVVQRRQTEATATAALLSDAQAVATASGAAIGSATTTTAAPTTVAAAPLPTTTPKAPTTRATPASPGPAAATSSQPPRTDFGPRRPGSVDLPYRTGQAVWSATSNGMGMTLRMETANPVAGTPVHFVLEASPPAGVPCCFFQFEPRGATPFSTQTAKTDPAGCAHPTTGPQRVDATLTFNQGGRFEFLFQASSLCVNPDTSGDVYGFVDIGAGRSTAQGPQPPVLQADDGRTPAEGAADPLLAVAYAHARDEDGYIAGFTVDWGDGTPVASFPGDPIGCRPTENGWPAASDTMISGSSRNPMPSHHYPTMQPHDIIVTVWSTGCDGSEVQRVSSTFHWGPVFVFPPVPVTTPTP
jgi:hypothetical protein